MTSTQFIESISKIVNQYELFLIDQWGVLHNGYIGYPSAINCIKDLIKLRKKLIIISNSSKRKKPTIERLPKLGFNKIDFFEVVTSGEIIWQNLYLKSHDFFKDLGNKCYHLTDKTKEDGNKYIEGLDYEFVNNIENADFILGSTTFPGMSTIDYVPILEQAFKKNLPFICANPDFETVESTSNNLIICMGAVAELYKDFGGSVFMMGKPSEHIYYEAIKNLNNIDKNKILAIGDSLYHDIKGACNFGIDSLFISSGIHKSYFAQPSFKRENINNYFSKFKVSPTYLCSEFRF